MAFLPRALILGSRSSATFPVLFTTKPRRNPIQQLNWSLTFFQTYLVCSWRHPECSYCLYLKCPPFTTLPTYFADPLNPKIKTKHTHTPYFLFDAFLDLPTKMIFIWFEYQIHTSILSILLIVFMDFDHRYFLSKHDKQLREEDQEWHSMDSNTTLYVLQSSPCNSISSVAEEGNWDS